MNNDQDNDQDNDQYNVHERFYILKFMFILLMACGVVLYFTYEPSPTRLFEAEMIKAYQEEGRDVF